MTNKFSLIDPHIHLFDIAKGQYHWLQAENPPFWPDKKSIHKTYNDDSLQLSPNTSLFAYVHIEAGFSNTQGHLEIENTEQRANLPQRSIGHIDITLDPNTFMIELGTQAKCQSAVGIRHIFEDTDSQSVMAILENPNSRVNLTFLAKHNGIFELQCDVNKRELLIHIFTFFQGIPNLQLVLNHAGFAPAAFKPANTTKQPVSELGLNEVTNEAFQDWKANIQLLSQLPKIAVKCSGFEMLNRDYDTQHVHAVIAHCLDVFGLDNVMLASNFPLCELTHSYAQYWQQLLSVVDTLRIENLDKGSADKQSPGKENRGNQTPLSIEQKKALYYDNAFRIYQFDKVT